MPFTLAQIVPWGRSLAEYSGMFALSRDDLQGRILGCGDGPASFNAEASARGAQVISCDPIYAFAAAQIRTRFDTIYPQIMEQTRLNQSEFVWQAIPSIEALGQMRRQAMERFLMDFASGMHAGRYLAAQLPELPFRDASFALALCSHFLFLYTQHLTEAFHIQSVREMCRVAREVRIFPLLALGAIPSEYTAAVAEALRQDGFAVSVETVNYEFQRGGNQMMRIRRAD